MYQCDGCGWTTAGFRLDAVHDHEGNCPECMGTIRLVFHVGMTPAERDPGRVGMRLVPEPVAEARAAAEGEPARTAPAQG